MKRELMKLHDMVGVYPLTMILCLVIINYIVINLVADKSSVFHL